MHCLLPGGGLCGALPVTLAAVTWKWWKYMSARCGASWTGLGIGGRGCSSGRRVVGASMGSVRTLVEDYSPCCGSWRAAAAPESVGVPCSLVPVWRPALHPQGMRAALVPPRSEWSEGAFVCAQGGTHTGWWLLVVSQGVMACRLPWGLRDLFGPCSLMS